MAAVLFAGAAPDAMAYYNVTIGATDTAGAWAGNVWTPSGAGSTVSASAIQSKLASGPVTINTGSAADGGADAGDINVGSAVSWDANTLTLSAAHALNINAVMTAGGTAGLAVNVANLYPIGGPLINAAMGNGGFIGRVDFTGSGNTIAINGTPGVIITTLGAAGSYCNDNGLQGMNQISVPHVLGADIDATPTASWNGGLGFEPLGGRCAGLFINMPDLDGLGHTIDGLTINRPTAWLVGLSQTPFSMAQNMGLTNVNIVGGTRVGAVAGMSGNMQARISNIYVTGSVSATGNGSSYPGIIEVGGLIGATGFSLQRVNISNVYVNANITGLNSANPDLIFNDRVGGLIGHDGGDTTLDGAYTTGTVSGRDAVGGLIGLADNTLDVITNVYSTATVNASVGGGMVGSVPSLTSSSIDLTYFDGLMNISGMFVCEPLSFDAGNLLIATSYHYYNSETRAHVFRAYWLGV